MPAISRSPCNRRALFAGAARSYKQARIEPGCKPL